MKVNVIVWLEFELAYYAAAVHHFRNHATRINSKTLGELWIYLSVRVNFCHFGADFLQTFRSCSSCQERSLTCTRRSGSDKFLDGIHLTSSMSYCPCLICSFCQPSHLILIWHHFVIVNHIRCLINKLWLFSLWIFKITVPDPPKVRYVALGLKTGWDPLVEIIVLRVIFEKHPLK